MYPPLTLVSLLAFSSGAFLALILAYIFVKYKKSNLENLIREAKKEATHIEEIAEERADKIRKDLEKKEKRLEEIEERLYSKESSLARKEEDVLLEKNLYTQKQHDIEREKSELLAKERNLQKEKEAYLGVSKEALLASMVRSLEKEHEADLLSLLYKLDRDGEQRLAQKAKDILTSSVYRLANTEVASFTTSTIDIDDPDIKGKIIGKEGRNIKAFERITGVEVLVDEAPNALVISCFDPVRRAIAKNALEMLIKDGRIQPAKIEECVEKAKRDIGIFMKKKGEEAIMECGLAGIPDALAPLLGRLYFRTSYGQNVLNHSIEMAHIAGMLASELGADVYTAKAGALLHDIGKAVDHDIKGTHVEIGRKILAKYGVSDEVIQAMQAHHEEYPYETLESVIVQVADAISGGRPGARRDTVERYIERLEDLEAIALAFSGIEKVYALQAGREIRIFVSPSLVSDLEARNLARQVALRVEEELHFPGEIKITVVRESQAIEFAR